LSAAPGPRIGYGRQFIDAADEAAVIAVLRGERLTQGPTVPLFEGALAETVGARHAVAVSNGTCALQLALTALDIGAGKRVLTPANTFLASATSALHCGAEVEFVDIEFATGQIDLDLLQQRVACRDVDAVVAVHFGGASCDMPGLIRLKRRYGFRLIEDACHALGATWSDGERRWRVGEHPEVDASVFSFHPVKHVTTGEGGAVTCQSPALARRLRLLREHGIDREGDLRPFSDSINRPAWFAPMVELGFNFRMSDLAAALGLSQLGRLTAGILERRRQARTYAEGLHGFFTPPLGIDRLEEQAWHLYVVRVRPSKRDALMQCLEREGIGTQVHYYPVPCQPWFRERYGRPVVREALRHARTSLSLPLYPGLTEEEQQHVIDVLTAWRRDS
jgi:dTDP-4-amino-4,6-dideoxygalactose transaminase